MCSFWKVFVLEGLVVYKCAVRCLIRCNSFLLLLHSIHYYTLYLTTEGRGEKVGCVAASVLHRVPVLFLPCSQLAVSLPVLFYTSMYVFSRLISSWCIFASGISIRNLRLGSSQFSYTSPNFILHFLHQQNSCTVAFFFFLYLFIFLNQFSLSITDSPGRIPPLPGYLSCNLRVSQLLGTRVRLAIRAALRAHEWFGRPGVRSEYTLRDAHRRVLCYTFVQF